jgi:uncharacterized protein YoxC
MSITTNTYDFGKGLPINISFQDDRAWQAIQGLQTQLDRIEKELTAMSQRVTDFATKEQQVLDQISAKVDDVKTGVANLDALIKTLQDDPSDTATLDKVSAASSALLDKVGAIDTSAPASQNPAPTPAS